MASNGRTRSSVRRAPGAPTADDAAIAARAAALVESSHDAILTETLDGTIQSWNPSAERLYGYCADEIVGHPLSRLIPPDRAGEMRAILDRIVQGQRVEPFDTVRVRKDGTRIDVSVSVSPLRDSKGRIIGAAAIGRDIGAHKRLERLLAETQSLAHIGNWEWDPVTDRLTWSDECYRIFGLEPGCRIGYPGTLQYIHPADHALIQRLVAQALKDGQPYTCVYRVLHPDGAERTVEAHATVVMDEVGRPVRMFGTAQDITERKRGEETLHRTQREFREIFEHTDVGIFRSSRVGRILLANQAFATMLGYSSPQDLYTVELPRDVYADPQERDRLIAQYEPSGRAWTVEVLWKKRDGTPFWLMANVHAVKDQAGRTMYFETFAQDATERRRLEAERDALSHRLIGVQEEERRDLARELHDEIGQLLTGLKLMLEGGGSLGGTAEMTQLLREVSARVRDVSHRLRPPMLDELGLLPTLRWHLERHTQRTGVRVRFSQAGLERRFPGAVEMAVFRIVQEALTNVARHAGVTESAVDLEAFADRLCLRVEDRGVGFQAQAVSAPAARGLRGMRERLRLLGGTFSVQAAPGAGTRIVACVPFVHPSSGMLV